MISQAIRILGNIGGVLLIGILLAACSSQEPRVYERRSVGEPEDIPERREKSAKRVTIGERAAVVAVKQLGVSYRYGGSTTDGFDCSGLVHYAYSKAGKAIPRTTGGQWRSLQPVTRDQLRVGDLLFFDIDGNVSHVGLYLGRRRFVHAPSTGREVTIEELDSTYYRRAFVRGGRP
jgi:cell wall-associated NlpC family hydrolase